MELQQSENLVHKTQLEINMKLVEIKDQFNMDVGAPDPMVFSTGNKTFVVFFGTLTQDNETRDLDTVMIEFTGCIKSSFGLPNNEILHGHPYYSFGLRSYGFYELENSDLLMQIIEMQSVHAEFNPEKWKFYKHYVITFHDELFECIARKFIISRGDGHYQQMLNIVNIGR